MARLIKVFSCFPVVAAGCRRTHNDGQSFSGHATFGPAQ
jgi:hypothetical protein